MLLHRLLKATAVAGLTAGLILLASSDALVAGPNPKDVEKYTNDLKTSKDAKVRVKALAELGKAGQIQKSLVKPAEEYMFKALEDKSAEVRAAAAKAVGMIDPDPKKAVPILVKMMKEDKDDTVKIAAAQGLGNIGEGAKPAVGDLKGVIKSESKNKGSKLSKAAKQALTTINPRPKKD
jgi:HEAT repeat protein